MKKEDNVEVAKPEQRPQLHKSPNPYLPPIPFLGRLKNPKIKKAHQESSSILEAIKTRMHEEIPIKPEPEDATITHFGDEIVNDEDSHNFTYHTSSVANEELEKEEMNIEVKEAEDVHVEEPLLFKESDPLTPPSLSLGHLRKGPMDKLLFGFIIPFYKLCTNLSLFYVIRNMSSYEKYFQDLITYRRKFETLEFD